MPLFEFESKSPVVDPEAFVAPTATLIGDVTVEARASIWYGAVLRGDYGPIVVREGANVQDNTVIHTEEAGAEIGAGATIGHSCVVHGARIGARALIGNSATVLDGARIGDATMVAAGALITPETTVESEKLIMGAPAKKVVELTDTARSWVEGNPERYQELGQRHKNSVREV